MLSGVPGYDRFERDGAGADVGEDLEKTVTRILADSDRPRTQLVDELFPHVYDSLRQRAGALMAGERRDHTLQATALVNEAYLKLLRENRLEIHDDVHLKAVGIRAMRQILVDHARKKKAVKRGSGGPHLRFDEALDLPPGRATDIDLLDLHDALERLREIHARRGQVAELKMFGSLTFAEVAELLEVAPKTVESDWYLARNWLRMQLAR